MCGLSYDRSDHYTYPNKLHAASFNAQFHSLSFWDSVKEKENPNRVTFFLT